ncbi:4'-phosphopantetheinyl transferase family protein [Streptomyces canus]|uniref:4'-phosphopantetheinyl transferase family protein n=1 Tax=Streptomyces canus TaxID=58343 RepID=UPI002E264F06|nr:4'-phosphopantetheinyl transferase superfamily protein [Streptomyces canus]
MERSGNVTVLTTWREWLSTALTQPSLKPLLGRDWQRFQQTATPVVRYRFAASRLALKYTAAAVLGTGPAELDLSYALDGRPYLRGLGTLEVSLSHAEDLIAVSLCRSGRIGVDTESTTAGVDAEALRGHACTAPERELLDRLPEGERDAELLRLWTLKEAYTKALGQGLRFGFTEFGFAPHAASAGGLLRTPDGTPVDSPEWTFATWPELGGRYLVSVACQNLTPAVPADLAAASLLAPSVVGALTEELARDRSPRGGEDLVERRSADRARVAVSDGPRSHRTRNLGVSCPDVCSPRSP